MDLLINDRHTCTFQKNSANFFVNPDFMTSLYYTTKIMKIKTDKTLTQTNLLYFMYAYDNARGN